MVEPTLLPICRHGRRRPHAWWCHTGPSGVAHICVPPGVPGDARLIVSGEPDDAFPQVEIRSKDQPESTADMCRCGGIILEMADGSWRHPDSARECLDTRPAEDP